MFISIRMCGHGGKRMIAGYLVDGFWLETNTALQFHGCHWHGCLEYFPEGQKDRITFEKRKEGKRFLTREMQYAGTLERGKAILEEGFELIECWEQDFNESRISPKNKTETIPHAIGSTSRHCWTRANARRKTCCSKASTCRCLFCR